MKAACLSFLLLYFVIAVSKLTDKTDSLDYTLLQVVTARIIQMFHFNYSHYSPIL